MCTDTPTTTPAKLAADLREKAKGVTFNDPYGVVNRHFENTIDSTATVLECMMNGETPGNELLLRELVYHLTHAGLYSGDPYAAAYDPVDDWFRQWSYGSHPGPLA